MEEIWKDIKGYSGYQVSNLGRVRTHNKITYTEKHGEKIDWNDFDQCKYLISYNNKNKKLEINNVLKIQDIGQIYCLYDNFLDKAIEKIGEEKLTKLFTYERN